MFIHYQHGLERWSNSLRLHLSRGNSERGGEEGGGGRGGGERGVAGGGGGGDVLLRVT